MLQVCDSSDSTVASPSPATATTSATADATAADDTFWPFAYHDAVLLHLCDVTPLSHLAQDGDFFFCLQLASAPDSAERIPSLVVKLRSAEGVKELAVGEAEYRAAFSTMDWVKQAKSAPDHELSYILRQCLIATEYTVRHLQWEETLHERGPARGAQEALSPGPGVHSHGPGVVHSQGHGVPSHGCSQGHGGGVDSQGSQEQRGAPSQGQRGGVPSQRQGGVPSQGHGEGLSSHGHGEGVPSQAQKGGPSQRHGLPLSRSPGQGTHSQGSSQHSPNSSSPDSRRGLRRGVQESGGSDSDSTLVSDDSCQRTSGSAVAGGDGGGGADNDGDRSCGSVSDGDAGEGTGADSHRNGDASPAERCASGGKTCIPWVVRLFNCVPPELAVIHLSVCAPSQLFVEFLSGYLLTFRRNYSVRIGDSLNGVYQSDPVGYSFIPPELFPEVICCPLVVHQRCSWSVSFSPSGLNFPQEVFLRLFVCPLVFHQSYSWSVSFSPSGLNFPLEVFLRLFVVH